MSTSRFYSDLPIYPFDSNTLFSHAQDFIQIPDDWFVLFTDVEGSTDFWERHQYATVNKIASAGIEIVIRSAIKHGIEVPYVYGGDGIVACFPPELSRDIAYECSQLYRYAHAVCGANLRVGIVPVSDITQAGLSLPIKRVGNEKVISHTLFDDSAFAWIEECVKHKSQYSLDSVLTDISLKEIRYENYVLPLWQKLQSPRGGDNFIALVIKVMQSDRLPVYHRLVSEIGECMPSFFRDYPMITIEQEKVFSVDFLKTTGNLNMILSGSDAEISCLVGMLHLYEQQGIIMFGHVVSDTSIVTHLIQESDSVYAGLLDVENGGYVQAAQELKRKQLDLSGTV